MPTAPIARTKTALAPDQDILAQFCRLGAPLAVSRPTARGADVMVDALVDPLACPLSASSPGGTPPDIEARFGMTGGHIFHGELVPEQAFDMRPVPGSTSYEGPIGGLFLCGSGGWPGGCVMGAPGHNAAQEIIARMQEGRALRSA